MNGPDVGDGTIPAGYTYFGQFLDHDLTFRHRKTLLDPPSTLGVARNLRTPRFDLDSVYGRVPSIRQPRFELDPASERMVFRIGRSLRGYADENLEEPDLPRVGGVYAAVARKPGAKGAYRTMPGGNEGDPPAFDVDPDEVRLFMNKPWARVRALESVRDVDKTPRPVLSRTVRWMGFQALIAGERNDQTVMVGQLHLAYLRAHNRAVLEAPKNWEPDKAFYNASKLLCWHHQWLVVHDYLPRLLGSHDAVQELLEKEPEEFVWLDGEKLPDEFTLAAFRMGHAMVRPAYRLNETRTPVEIPLFADEVLSARGDLRGGRSLPEGWSVQWNLFLDRGGPFQAARAFAPTLAPPMATFRSHYRGKEEPLPYITLAKGLEAHLPSGQAVARWMEQEKMLRPGQVLSGDEEGDDPLWIYVLKEAEQLGKGRTLGPVGASIVGETLVGVLRMDPRSYLNEKPDWKPHWGGDSFELASLLRYAEMAMDGDQVENLIRRGRP